MEAVQLAIRSRRLDRLREARRPAEAPGMAASSRDVERAVAPPTLAVLRHDRSRASRLAETLGGRVERHDGASVVVVEAAGSLPLARETLSRLPDPVAADRPLVCLDTETTGLGTAAGTFPFLVGLGTWSGERFAVRQYVLADHADESALLGALASAIPADAWLVTYNGRSFDWPLLVTRYRLHRRGPPAHAGHLDLLGLARQVWRHRLPDARLASVESGIVGVRRIGDLSGALIPARYFECLRTGRYDGLVDVVRHNRQDVGSLARLLAWLARALDPAAFGSAMEPGDLAGLGRAYVRRRRYAEALACYDTALRWSTDDRTVADRARLLARLGRADEAAAAWLWLAERGGSFAPLAWIQVAKHREHAWRDIAGALDATERAARLAARARVAGRPLSWIERDVSRRAARLRRLSASEPAPSAWWSAA